LWRDRRDAIVGTYLPLKTDQHRCFTPQKDRSPNRSLRLRLLLSDPVASWGTLLMIGDGFQFRTAAVAA
jgi:hypothetical protein